MMRVHNLEVLCWLFSMLLTEVKQHKQFMYCIDRSGRKWVGTEHVLKCLGNAFELGEDTIEWYWFSLIYTKL